MSRWYQIKKQNTNQNGKQFAHVEVKLTNEFRQKKKQKHKEYTHVHPKY